ncbi:MAG: hypothetical protein ACRDRX_21080 [Pseudonocardiaceae bacterium]
MSEGVDRTKLQRWEPVGFGRPRAGRWPADPAATEHGRQAARSVVVRVDNVATLLHARAAVGGALDLIEGNSATGGA